MLIRAPNLEREDLSLDTGKIEKHEVEPTGLEAGLRKFAFQYEAFVRLSGHGEAIVGSWEKEDEARKIMMEFFRNLKEESINSMYTVMVG